MRSIVLSLIRDGGDNKGVINAPSTARSSSISIYPMRFDRPCATPTIETATKARTNRGACVRRSGGNENLFALPFIYLVCQHGFYRSWERSRCCKKFFFRFLISPAAAPRADEVDRGPSFRGHRRFIRQIINNSSLQFTRRGAFVTNGSSAATQS